MASCYLPFVVSPSSHPTELMLLLLFQVSSKDFVLLIFKENPHSLTHSLAITHRASNVRTYPSQGVCWVVTFRYAEFLDNVHCPEIEIIPSIHVQDKIKEAINQVLFILNNEFASSSFMRLTCRPRKRKWHPDLDWIIRNPVGFGVLTAHSITHSAQLW